MTDFLLAHLTDTHVMAEGDTLFGLDTNARLERAVDAVVRLDRLPDAVVVTGDLTNDGTPAQYDALRARLDPLPMPVHLVIGNHDERAALRAGFPSLTELAADDPTSPVTWVVEEHAVRLVALDSSIPDRHDGALDEAQVGWLDAVLGERPDVPTCVLVHHPPFDTGIWWMDAGGMRSGGELLEEVVRRHPQVERVLVGHHHRTIVTTWGTCVVAVAPNPAHQVSLALDPDSDPGFVEETPQFQLHWWRDGGVVTHVAAVEPPANALDLSQPADRWERYRRDLVEGNPLWK